MAGIKYDHKWQYDFNSLFKSYKRAAAKRDVEWGLTKEQFAMITQKSCYLCGRKPHRVHKHAGKNSHTAGYKYNGVDRLANDRGYTEENSRPCCGDCNRMKSDLTLDKFKEHIIRIVKVIL